MSASRHRGQGKLSSEMGRLLILVILKRGAIFARFDVKFSHRLLSAIMERLKVSQFSFYLDELWQFYVYLGTHIGPQPMKKIAEFRSFRDCTPKPLSKLQIKSRKNASRVLIRRQRSFLVFPSSNYSCVSGNLREIYLDISALVATTRPSNSGVVL